jgi:hypothetical protein
LKNHTHRRHIIGVDEWAEERTMAFLLFSRKELASQAKKEKYMEEDGDDEDEEE